MRQTEDAMDGGHPYRNRKRIERTERAGGE